MRDDLITSQMNQYDDQEAQRIYKQGFSWVTKNNIIYERPLNQTMSMQWSKNPRNKNSNLKNFEIRNWQIFARNKITQKIQ